MRELGNVGAQHQVSATTTVGFGIQLRPLTDEVIWSSSNKHVASVNANGVVTPKRPGKAIITGKVASGSARKLSAQYRVKITVKANAFTRKTPLKLSGAGLYSSMKSLKYKGGKLHVEMFVFNRGGMAVRRFEQMRLEVWSGGALIYSEALPGWKLRTPLKKGKHAVYRLSIAPEKLPAIQYRSLDLARGTQVRLEGFGADRGFVVPLPAIGG